MKNTFEHLRNAVDQIVHWKAWGLFRRVERRRSPRQVLGVTISVSTSNGQVYKGVTRDVSETGIGALIYGDLNVGDFVTLKFQPAGKQEKSCRAVVMQRFGYRCGFQFKSNTDLRLDVALNPANEDLKSR